MVLRLNHDNRDGLINKGDILVLRDLVLRLNNNNSVLWLIVLIKGLISKGGVLVLRVLVLGLTHHHRVLGIHVHGIWVHGKI